MENILQEIHGCRKCLDAGYESVRPPPVFEGSIDAPILIIGQAPGIEEFNQRSSLLQDPAGTDSSPGSSKLALKKVGQESMPSSFSAACAIQESSPTGAAIAALHQNSLIFANLIYPGCYL